MKKRTLALLAAAMMLLAGCSEESSSSGVEIPDVEEGQTVTYGKVTYVAGNDLTLAVGTLKEGGSGGMAPGASGLEQGEAAERQSARGDSGRGGMEAAEIPAMAEGGGEAPMGEMFGGGGTASGAAPAAAQPSVSLDLTGEEETIRVPVGVPVYAAMGTRNISTDFTQIFIDNIVQVVWDSNEEGQYVVWIQVLS